METIRIGTCVPGQATEKLLPHFVRAGFECVALNFHMEFPEKDLPTYWEKVRPLLEGSPVKVSSIGFYCNALENEGQRKTLEHFIDNAHLFGTDVVTTFAGALEGQPVEKAIPRYKEVFGELARRAEAKGVRLAIENCPMDGTWHKATCNIGFNPKAWEMMFDAVPSRAIGLEWEPAHQMVQLIDPLPQLEEWADRVYHIHGKDATLHWDRVRKWGVFGAGEFAESRTPGYGDTDWRDVFHILYSRGYVGDLVVEGFHDPIFKEEREWAGQLHALEYLKWCRGGTEKSPW